MAQQAPASCPPLAVQHGAALMVMLVILVLGASAWLLSALNRGQNAYTRASQQSGQPGTTLASLAAAKAALIGYALTDSNRPGELPCPDSNNDGSAELLSGDACPGGNLGRLPWRTLGTERLTDDAGETLWYAVADAYRPHSVATPLHSDIPGSLSVSGTLAETGIVAIVFAPGRALPGQERTATGVNDYTRYLESVASSPTAFTLQTPNDSGQGTYTYNDQLALIRVNDFMPDVAKVVATKLKNDAPSLLQDYYANWNAYPYAASFVIPATASYTGTAGSSHGLWPAAATTPTWAAVPSISFSGPNAASASATCTLRNAAGSSCTSNCVGARCSGISGVTNGTVIRIEGRLLQVGMGFWKLYAPAAGTDNTAACTQEICVRRSSDSRYFTASSALNDVSLTGTLNSDGSADIVFQGTVKSSLTPNRIQFNIVGLPALALPEWIKNNEWYRTFYYAVDPRFLPGAAQSCTPPCLTVKDNSSRHDDVRALLVVMNGALGSQQRPSNALADYLEGSNLEPASAVYETRTRSATFNDIVVPLAP